MTSPRSKILLLKRTQNPATGNPFTYQEIAPLVGMKSGQLVAHHVKDVQGCPCCLRRLQKLKKRIYKPKTKRKYE